VVKFSLTLQNEMSPACIYNEVSPALQGYHVNTFSAFYNIILIMYLTNMWCSVAIYLYIYLYIFLGIIDYSL